MTGYRDAAALFANLAAFRWRDANNVLQTAAQVYMRDASGRKPLLISMSATATPSAVYGYGSSATPIRITTSSCSVAVVGGTAPYSYFWETVEADWVALSPTSAATIFRSPTIPASDFATAVFTCTVTDASGMAVVSNGVAASVSNTGV